MKMIYVGSLTTAPDRDSCWISAFEKLGCIVLQFSSYIIYNKGGYLKQLFWKVCNRLNIGPKNKRMQKSLLALVEQEKPVWIHFRMPIGFNRKTIERLKKNNIIITEYFNDDAFSKSHALGLHWKFRHALSSYDGHFIWRARDIKIYRKFGAHHVEHSPPYYDPERVKLEDELVNPHNFLADAAFIGHWEDDWRVDCLDGLASAGLSVILKGGNEGWEPAIKGRKIQNLAPITWAFDDEYCKIYSNVVAGLCFFSKINNDGWTRRALEIIAVGGVLVCERNEEAKQYFNDREEAYFFSSVKELITIVKELKNDTAMRERVRVAGHARLMKGSHTISCRAKQVYHFAAAKVTASVKVETAVNIKK
jgi:hypothetical protein